MAYLGPPPSQKVATPTSQYFSGNGSATAFTLNRPVNVAEDLNVFVNNVAQQPGSGKSYTATGTTLTFDAAPASGTNNVYVVYRGLAEPTTRLEHPSGQPLAATTGTFSTAVRTDSLQNAAGSVIRPVMAGGIIQTQYTQLTTAATQAWSANTATAFTDLTVNITPTSTSSIIKLECHIAGEFADDSATFDHVVFFYRDTTALKFTGSTSGSKVGLSAITRTHYAQDDNSTGEVGYFTYFDSPNTTSQITYKLGIVSNIATTFHINTTVSNDEYFVSNISATEIGQ